MKKVLLTVALLASMLSSAKSATLWYELPFIDPHVLHQLPGPGSYNLGQWTINAAAAGDNISFVDVSVTPGDTVNAIIQGIGINTWLNVYWSYTPSEVTFGNQLMTSNVTSGPTFHTIYDTLMGYHQDVCTFGTTGCQYSVPPTQITVAGQFLYGLDRFPVDPGNLSHLYTFTAIPISNVPLPSAVILFSSALGLMGFLGRKRKLV